MKIVALRLAGFGPFKTEQRINFEAFDDAGIFLITGRTGAGKSSILDAVCYALYGTIPRFDGAQQKLRSDHCEPDDPTFVSLDFRVGDSLYRVQRSPEFERRKRKGAGTTTSPPSASLSRKVDSTTAVSGPVDEQGEQWEGLAARPVDVGKVLGHIVTLTRDQFLQVVLLAQNRFQQFLRSSNDDRQTILRSLFGTERFLTYETLLVEKQKTLAAELDGADAALIRYTGDLSRLLSSSDPSPEPSDREFDAGLLAANTLAGDSSWFEAATLQLEADVSRVGAEAIRTSQMLDDSELELTRLTELRSLVRRRDAATHALESLLAETEQISQEKKRLEKAESARLLWPYICSKDTAIVEHAAADLAEATARDIFSAYGDRAISSTAVGDLVDELHRRLGGLESPLEEERSLQGLASEVLAGEQNYARGQREESELVEMLADLPRQIVAITASITEARVSAELEPSTADTVDRLAAACDASSKVSLLSAELGLAEVAELAASSRHLAAAGHHQSLMERRLSGHAAELASELVPGQPCAVCGSSVHPAPAQSVKTPISRSMVDAARASLAEFQDAMDAATAARVLISTRRADAEARTDGRTVEALGQQLVGARAALEVCRAAVRASQELPMELGEFVSALENGRRQLHSLELDRQQLFNELAAKRSTWQSSVRRIDSERGAQESVFALVGALSTQLDCARDLKSAIELRSRCETTLVAAQTHLGHLLSESGFADEAAVVDARLETVQFDAAATRVRLWEQEVATSRSILTDPQLASLGRSDAESDDATIALAADRRNAARLERDRALTSGATVIARRREAGRIATAAAAVLRESTAQNAEFEEVRALANALQGKDPNTRRMRLETYVLAAQLEQIVASANVRLRTMTSGRYTLLHDDSVQYRNTQSGLGLSILDEHTGRTRATHSLSGGETFLASLALALGLAEVVSNQAGGIKLDTLFIDEGFGSLDDQTLDVAMATLDGLRAGGRTIGLISHVGSMKEQIASTLSVTVTAQGDSTIITRVA